MNKTIAFLLILFYLGAPIQARANFPPHFVLSSPQNLNVCKNSTDNLIDSLLSISDLDVGQTEVWSIVNSPVHGTLTGFSYSALSVGDELYTTGLSFTPTVGFVGTDSFEIQISDGFDSTAIVIVVTVNPLPAAVFGPDSVCVNSSVIFSDSSSSGSWISSDPTSAYVNSVGSVHGISAGTISIAYVLLSSCMSTKSIRVNPLPASIPDNFSTGLSTCVGNRFRLIDSTSGGVWRSSDTTVVTIDASGLTEGVARGYSTIFYTLPDGCQTQSRMGVKSDTVFLPYDTVCYGSTAYIYDPDSTSLIWFTQAGDIVGSAHTLFSYSTSTTYPTQCYIDFHITTNPLPAVITGHTSVCMGAIDTLNESSTGGSWTSSNSTIATISSSGLVFPVSPGSVIITYSLPTGCYVTENVTVNALPDSISIGTRPLCKGDSIQLHDISSPGTWKSSVLTCATISSFGYCLGKGVGATIITFTQTSTGCATTKSLSVDLEPQIITGSSSVCQAQTLSLADTNTTGRWNSSTPTHAIVDSTGLVTAISPGTDTIFYTLSSGCFKYKIISINPLPLAILGDSTVCVGQNISFFDSTHSGIWTNRNRTLDTFIVSNEIVALAGGIDTITYTLPSTGCHISKPITINSLPGRITGIDTNCLSYPTILSDSSGFGSWSITSAAIATISSTGTFTSTGLGIDTAIYTLSTGCMKMLPIRIFPLPANIIGAASLCPSQSTILHDSTSGGNWRNIHSAIDSISSVGILYGLTSGADTIVYTLPTGCFTSFSIVVEALPLAVYGDSTICLNGNTIYVDSSIGGNWSTSNLSVASIDSFGNLSASEPGYDTVIYTVATGCSKKFPIKVNPLPVNITGPTRVCIGSSISLADTSHGGIWSLSNVSIASINTSGIVTGLRFGFDTAYYTLLSGCSKMFSFLVDSVPSAITGLDTVCQGSSISLSESVIGGSWTSTNTSIATVNSFGVVTGETAGRDTIIYSLANTCSQTFAIRINALPSVIAGSSVLCAGRSASFSDTVTGGSWSVSNTSVGTINSSGLFNGNSSGTDTVTYRLGTGCATRTIISVIPLPPSISGSDSVCVNTVVALSDSSGGGVWSVNNTSLATITSSGMVTGLAAGRDTVQYTISSGCLTKLPIVINPLPKNITGTNFVCPASVASLTDSSTLGTWRSSQTSIATVNSAGVVTGVTSGMDSIFYSLPTGCTIARPFTVYNIPLPILGPDSVCMGQTINLYDSTASGTWSSKHNSIATISSSGLVRGITAGIDTVIYTSTGTGCVNNRAVTVNALPAQINGQDTLCVGLSFALTDSVTGGNWVSNDTMVASISTFGVITGIATGTSTITYTLSTGCSTYRTKIINQNIHPITGESILCEQQAGHLSDSTMGGIWTSSNPAIATIASTGTLNGVSSGFTIITYTILSGCHTTDTVLINPLPSNIAGVANVCPGQTITLSDTTAGGSWLTSNSTIATVSNSGIVTGLTPGTDTILYILPTGCQKILPITVNHLPVNITGATSLCVNHTMTLTDISSGGSWISGNMGVATINSTGVVSGVSAGTSVITYTLTTGCFITDTVVVNALPNSITGDSVICLGQTTSLSNTTAFGTWSSSNTGVASVNTSGTVTGISPGADSISYVLGTGCKVFMHFIVNPLPTSIHGIDSVCPGQSIQLTDSSGAGTWSSLATSIATINSSGLVYGVGAGSDTVTFSLATGCSKSFHLKVNPLPGTIVGRSAVCFGLTISLSDTTNSGIWSTHNHSIDTINLTGHLFGRLAGGDTVYYTLPTGCYNSLPIVVNPLPATITGLPTVCPGQEITLSDSTGGGNWSSSNGSLATISSTGIVNGVFAGVDTISYILPTGCLMRRSVIVNPLPAGIEGASPICVGQTLHLSDTSISGAWSSSTLAIATIDTSGLLHGIAAGIDTVSYTLPTGCFVKSAIIINALPSNITGTPEVCPGQTTSLSDFPTGGTWSSNNSLLATISSGGLVFGLQAGIDTIIYTLSSGCIKELPITINPLPDTLRGFDHVCPGLICNLYDSTSGGTWSVTNSALTTITVTGAISGVRAGSDSVYYTLPTGCFRAMAFSVNPLPQPITGVSYVCLGQHPTLSDSTYAGSWSSSDTSIISINNTGTVSSRSLGTVTITYQLPTGCLTTYNLPVYSFPSDIYGTNSACPGTTTHLYDTTVSGTWSVSTSAIATISSVGILHGVIAGFDTAIYTLPTGCYKEIPIVVNPLPANIYGTSAICLQQSAFMSDSTMGGTWVSKDTTVVTINDSGRVTTIGTGADTITYVLPTGCLVTKSLLVNPLPANITGTLSVCPEQQTLLSDSTSGGVWSSTSISLATVSLTGSVTGVAAGIDTIVYTIGTGCFKNIPIVIHSLPMPITGTDSVCQGLSVVVADFTSGGVWYANDTAIATISSTGIVMGVNAGLDTIYYTLPTGCFVTFPILVNPLPQMIYGSSNVCPGTSIQIFDSTTGGIWSLRNNHLAGISGIGVITGISAGIDTAVYTLPTGCLQSMSVTINPLPAPIEGTDSVCVQSTIQFTDSVSGGSWSLASTGLASISTTGIIEGFSQGLDTATYTLPTGCVQTKQIKINPLPGLITGIDSVCKGAEITLFEASTTGAWSSEDTLIALMSGSGILTGMNAGSDSIFYTLPTGCRQSYKIKVDPLPDPLYGDSSVCVGSTVLLTDSTGRVRYELAALDTGILIITISTHSGCRSDIAVDVRPGPSLIAGNTGLCLGTTSVLSDSVSGGRWTTSDSTVASINDTGLLFARGIGTATVTYTIANSCYETKTVHVNHLFTISGITASNPTTCQGTNGEITLLGLGSGILYNINYIKNGMADTASFISNGAGQLVLDSLTAGIYTAINVALSGCTSNNMDTVLFDPPLPAIPTVTYNSPLCYGTTLHLSSTDSTSGVSFQWSGPVSFSSTLQNCFRSSVVLADTGYYKMTVVKNNCFSSDSVLVNILTIPVPDSISGVSLLCQGTSTLFADSSAGGIWFAANNHGAIDSISGLVYGLSLGWDTIFYKMENVCGADTVKKLLFIDRIPIPGAITGLNQVCVGSTIVLADTSLLGTWVTTNSRIGISSTGSLLGVLPGTDTVLFVVSNICGNDTASKTVTIIPLPVAGVITGPLSVCVGSSIVLADTTNIGIWSSSNTAVATIGATGIVYGVNADTTTIFYTYTNYCGTADTSFLVTVLPLPDAGTITGTFTLCNGSSTYLSDSRVGGLWSTYDSAVVSLSASGASGDSIDVIARSAGTTTIRYIYNNSCGADTTLQSVRVNPIPLLSSSLLPPAICSGTIFRYVPASSYPGATFLWSRGTVDSITNTSASGIDSINETLVNVGPYPVTVVYEVTTSSLGCINVQPVSVNVNPIPKLSSSRQLTACSQSMIDYVATSLTPGTTFAWARVPAAGIIPATDSGTYFIAERLTNTTATQITVTYVFDLSAQGCTSTEDVTVFVETKAPPAPLITTTSPTYLCSHTMYQNFGAESIPPPGITYSWSAYGADVWATGGTTQYCLVNFVDSGFNWVIVSASYTGYQCTTRDSFTVYVGNLVARAPEVIYNYPAFVCEDNTYKTYQWGYDDAYTLDSSLLEHETNQAYINSNPDFSNKYYWVITTDSVCYQKTYFRVPTLIQSPNEGIVKSVKIYPNPNNGLFEIEVISDFTEDGIAVVTNIIGEKIKQEPIITNTKMGMQIEAAAGVYFLNINTPHGNYVGKIVVQQ